MTTKLELLIRKNALKDVEVWLYGQYAEIDLQLKALADAVPPQNNIN